MPTRFSTGKPDKNKSLITAVLIKAGKNFIHLHEGDGADLLIIDSVMYFVEIKRDDLSPSKTELTPTEKILQALCKMFGIGYYVVFTPEQMAEILAERLKQ